MNLHVLCARSFSEVSLQTDFLAENSKATQGLQMPSSHQLDRNYISKLCYQCMSKFACTLALVVDKPACSCISYG